MTPGELAHKALAEVRKLMAQSTPNEAATIAAFVDVFDAEMEGWSMRLDEIDGIAEDEA